MREKRNSKWTRRRQQDVALDFREISVVDKRLQHVIKTRQHTRKPSASLRKYITCPLWIIYLAKENINLALETFQLHNF
jgi:hypothetical protein